MMSKTNTVYISKTWITGISCIQQVSPMDFGSAEARNKLSKARQKYVEGLIRKDIPIITDRTQIDDSTIYFDMDEDFIKASSGYEYKRKFDSLIFNAGGPNFQYPKTLTMVEYFFNPFYPAVLKNEFLNGGKDKFLIENEEQMKKIRDLYFDSIINPEFSQLRAVFNGCIFQKLIETPTEYSTYMRVLMGASGEIIGASLRYSKGEHTNRELEGVLEQYFLDPQSPYYLNCKRMFNYYSGGGVIQLPNKNLNPEREQVLMAHGIDPRSQEIPFEVAETARNIMKECHPIIGLICGFDFILNKKDGKWYYLENQSSPAIDEWAYQKGITIPKQPKNGPDYYDRYNDIAYIDPKTVRAYWNWVQTFEEFCLKVRHEELMKCLGLSYTYEEIMQQEQPTQPTRSAELPKRKSKSAQTGRKTKRKKGR